MFWNKKYERITDGLNTITRRLDNIQDILSLYKKSEIDAQTERYKSTNDKIQSLMEEIEKLKKENEIYAKYYELDSAPSDEIKEKVIRELEVKKLKEETGLLEKELKDIKIACSQIPKTQYPIMPVPYSPPYRFF